MLFSSFGAFPKGWLTLTTVQCVTNIVVGLAENNLKQKFYPNATSVDQLHCRLFMQWNLLLLVIRLLTLWCFDNSCMHVLGVCASVCALVHYFCEIFLAKTTEFWLPAVSSSVFVNVITAALTVYCQFEPLIDSTIKPLNKERRTQLVEEEVKTLAEKFNDLVANNYFKAKEQ